MTPIHDFAKAAGLSCRTYNALLNERIQFAEQLVRMPDSVLLRVPNFGRKSLMELRIALVEQNIKPASDDELPVVPGAHERVCYNCKHFSKETCRIYPPRIYVVDDKPITYWPQVENFDFCGEFVRGF